MRLMGWTAFLALAAQAQTRETLLDRVEARASHFGEISRRIWEFAEVGYQETRSSALLASELRAAGFRIEENVAGIPTAFTATWGQGKPVIAIMGEYDALPGLSQKIAPEKKPLVAGAPGHGCGHNLLGSGAALAAVAVKEEMLARKLPGTLRFYGTPAEEGGGGKVYMIRAGAFRDADVALSWHPGGSNMASKRSSLANISAKFRFYGTAAHAASAPEQGRSGLDGLLLMNHAVEMLREHVPASTRIHYIVTTGGSAPNIVPDFAEGYFNARHPHMPTLDGIWNRIVKCAEAGALASGARMEQEIVTSVYSVLPNDALSALVDRNLRRVGGMKYTAEEQAFAKSLRETFIAEEPLALGSQERIQTPDEGGGSASTDAGDVSWALPMAQLTTATYVPGTPGHSWQSAACSGSSIGRKGMVIAAKTLALSAVELMETPAEVAAARASFDRRRAGIEYRSRIPATQKPPLDYRGKR